MARIVHEKGQYILDDNHLYHVPVWCNAMGLTAVLSIRRTAIRTHVASLTLCTQTRKACYLLSRRLLTQIKLAVLALNHIWYAYGNVTTCLAPH